MKSILLNFGTNIRVVGDVSGENHVVGIGQYATVDLHPSHEQLIRRGMALGDALIILPEGISEAPVEMAAVAALLANVTTADYDMLLQAYHKVAPYNGADIRPDRNTMRTNLEAIGLMLSRGETPPQPGGKVFIKEEQTPATPPVAPAPEPRKDNVTTEDINKALGLGTVPFVTVPAVAKEEGNDVIDLPEINTPPAVSPEKAAKSKKPRAPRKAKGRAAA